MLIDFQSFVYPSIMVIVGLIILVAVYKFASWALTLRRVVPTNMVHIVQYKTGSVSYGRGKSAGTTYYAWPSWLPIYGVQVTQFPESNFQVMLQDYEAYDAARLPFKVDIAAFFRVENSETAAQRIESFGELQRQLKSILEGAVRRILGTNHLEEIMSERSKFGEEFTSEVKAQVEEWGVIPVKMIEFMDIRDSSNSQVIHQMMSKEKSRIEMESRIKVAENQQNAELKEIDAKRTVEINKQNAAEQIGLRVAEKDQAVGIANEKANQEIKAQAKITAEREMDVQQTNKIRTAEIMKESARIDAERVKEVSTIQAETDAKVNIVNAEAAKKSVVITAEGNLDAAKCNADAVRAEGEARAAAEKAIQMVPVDTQIALAKEVGANKEYQNYLITMEQIRVSAEVGKEFAASLQTADLKIIANSNNVQTGLSGLADAVSAKGGANISAMFENLTNTPVGAALVNKFLTPKSE